MPGPKPKHWRVAVLQSITKHSWGLPQDRQGNEAAPAPSRGTGKEIIHEVAAGTFLPSFLYPGTKHRGHVALRECHHLLLKVNQVVMSYPLLSRDLCFLGCIWMQETWRTPWKTNGSMSDLCLATLCLTPHSLRPKPACAWADQVTHHVTSASGIKQWHTEYLNLSLENQVHCLVNTVLSANHAPQPSFPVNEINEFGKPGTALIND